MLTIPLCCAQDRGVLTLVLGVSAIRATWKAGAECNGEAKVTLERIGPNGTFAGLSPAPSDTKLVVALAIHGTCWATGNFKTQGGAGSERKKTCATP
jgi:hypothetical protein